MKPLLYVLVALASLVFALMAPPGDLQLIEAHSQNVPQSALTLVNGSGN